MNAKKEPDEMTKKAEKASIYILSLLHVCNNNLEAVYERKDIDRRG
jgi:hypothetical protein